jgi:hypothetical protein
MLRALRREFVVDRERRQIDPVHRNHRRAQQRELHLFRHFQHRFGGMIIARQDDARNAALHHLLQNLHLGVLRQRFKIRHLRGTQNLHAFVREIFEESGQRQRRAIDAALVDQPVQSGLTDDEIHLELLAIRFEEVRNGDAVNGFLHGWAAGGVNSKR